MLPIALSRTDAKHESSRSTRESERINEGGIAIPTVKNSSDGTRINEEHAVHTSLDILSKDSFERVRADGGDIEEAQAKKLREMEAGGA